MKHGVTILCLSTLVLLCRCGGGEVSGGKVTASPPPQGVGIAGNWQFSLTSNVFHANPSATMSGSLAQSGSSLRGAMHFDASPCFDQLTTIDVGGTGAGSNLSLTSTSVAGQIITLTGRITNNTVDGTYAIDGGCANGDQGSLNGIKIPALTGGWRGHTIVSDQTGNLTLTLTQGNANADGTFGLSGSTSNATYFVCDEGTIASGTLTTPGSWVIGAQVFLQIQTTSGKANFSGTADQSGRHIQGVLQYVGGPCDGLFGEATFNR